MNLLIVTHSYAPEVSPRSFRWTTIAEYWARRGHQVDVVCAWHAGSTHAEDRAGVGVHRVGGALVEKFRQRLQPRMATASAGAVAPIGQRRSFAGRIARVAHDLTWKQLYWPDYAAAWIPAARRAADELLRNHSYDALITVSHPFTAHVVGARLHHRPRRWIADVGDPFAFLSGVSLNNRRLYGRLNYVAERRILRTTSKVSVTTPETRDLYLREFPELNGKVHVIPPLMSLPAYDGIRFFPHDDRIRLVFVGSLHPNVRTPEKILELFRALLTSSLGARLELHFVGDLNHCEQYFGPYSELRGNQIFCHGRLPRMDATRAMFEADLLVNLGNGTQEQLPSKVVEYVATGRPILNLAVTDADSSSAFFRGYSAAHVLNCSDTKNRAAIEELLGFIQNGVPAQRAEIDTRLRAYRVDAIARQYEELIGAI